MKELKLKKLSLLNFKGIKSLDIDFKEVTTISGDNGTGKTTIFDSFTWLLFGKDSKGNTDFSIKTLENGVPIEKIDHIVYAELLVGKSTVILRKEYRELWSRKRGSEKEEFTGHETLCFIDGVPKKAKEYAEYINSIMDETLFKLITNPFYFTSLKWQEQRQVLLSLVPSSVKDEIVSSNEEYQNLFDELSGISLEDFKVKKAYEKKHLKAELELIPARIDQTFKLMPEDKDTSSIEKEIQDLESKLAILTSPNQASLEREKLKLIESEASNILSAKSRTESYLQIAKSKAESIEKEMVELRSLWNSVDGRKFEHGTVLVCPLYGTICKDTDAAEKFDSDRSGLVQDFENKKKEEKANINSKGLRLKSSLSEIQKEITVYTEDLKNLSSEYEKATDKLNLVKDVISAISVTDNSVEISEIKSKIAELRLSTGAKERIIELRKEVDSLESRGREISQLISNIESREFVAQRFTKDYVGKVEEYINSKFDYIQFKMFDIQVNGQEVETCTSTVDGVPYKDVNNAGKINAGLDIIRTIGGIYDVTAPIFIDNAESINNILETGAQIIKLIVNKNKLSYE